MPIAPRAVGSAHRKRTSAPDALQVALSDTAAARAPRSGGPSHERWGISAPPSPSAERIASPESGRRRAHMACQYCRSHKARCDESWPRCSNCRKADVACVKVLMTPESTRKYIESLEKRCTGLQQQLDALRGDAGAAPSARPYHTIMSTESVSAVRPATHPTPVAAAAVAAAAAAAPRAPAPQGGAARAVPGSAVPMAQFSQIATEQCTTPVMLPVGAPARDLDAWLADLLPPDVPAPAPRTPTSREPLWSGTPFAPMDPLSCFPLM